MYSYSVKHNYKISKKTIDKVIDKFNAKKITFGVHKEDTNKHNVRDRVQNMNLHRLLYNNGKPIPSKSNAELLRLAEHGYETILYYGNQAHNVVVPSRPVLQPILQISLMYKLNTIKNSIRNQFKDMKSNVFNDKLNGFARYLQGGVSDFIKNRGMGYWQDAEHNSPYVQAVKFFDRLGESALTYKINNIDELMDMIRKWDTMFNYHQGDTPLMDSLDLLKSIKAKVEDK